MAKLDSTLSRYFPSRYRRGRSLQVRSSFKQFYAQDHSLSPPKFLGTLSRGASETFARRMDFKSTRKSKRKAVSADKEFAQSTVKSSSGAVLNELELGQPCLQCNNCSTGFHKHTWRHKCDTCDCPRYNHDIRHKGHVTLEQRMGEAMTEEAERAKEKAIKLGYAWVPGDLQDDEVDSYFSQLPKNLVPALGSMGERDRDRRLILQLPGPDYFESLCTTLKLGGKGNFREIKKYREDQAFGVGEVFKLGKGKKSNMACHKCEVKITMGTFAIKSKKFESHIAWHPHCFTCAVCELPLVDLGFFWRNGFLFCGRHWAEQLRPRCATCDQIICCNEVIQGGADMQENHHPGHFKCQTCQKDLNTCRYIQKDSHSYCVPCYEHRYANTCHSCNEKINADSKDLAYQDNHWHERCFICTHCNDPLMEKFFGAMEDKLYCDNCYDNLFGVKCDACGLPFKAGMKKLEWNKLQWHEECFKCTNCLTQIGCSSFMPKDDSHYCVDCFNSLFAPKCKACAKAIMTGGVLYHNEPYHKECFSCANCFKNLIKEKFTSREDKPYCAECFAELFARRCFTCQKPINGIGGTKFISFEGRDWHNECFNCNGVPCGGVNLVGKGFVTDKNDIFCQDCARLPFNKRGSLSVNGKMQNGTSEKPSPTVSLASS